MKGLFLVVLITMSRNGYGTELEDSRLKQKLFYVSRTTSTIPLSTSTVSYGASTPSNTLSILSDSIGTTSEEISPAKSTQSLDEAVKKSEVDIEFNNKEDINQLISGLDLTEREADTRTTG
jgi:hypothetical protein